MCCAHGLTGFQDEADTVNERAGVGHHLRGGQHAPEAGQLQGQATAIQACLKVQTQRDLLMDQMPCQGLKGRVGVTQGSGLPPSCLRAAGEANHPQLSGNRSKRERLAGPNYTSRGPGPCCPLPYIQA